LQSDVVLRIPEAVANQAEPWPQASAGIAAFLDASNDPGYQVVVLKQGPAAIGRRLWREGDLQFFADIANPMIDTRATAGRADQSPTMLRGALTALSSEIAGSADQARARREALAGSTGWSWDSPDPPDTFNDVSPVAQVEAAQRDSPVRIGFGQLRSSAGAYLGRVAAGETIEIIRRGRFDAQIHPTHPDNKKVDDRSARQCAVGGC
jgi:hypothetical protein